MWRKGTVGGRYLCCRLPNECSCARSKTTESGRIERVRKQHYLFGAGNYIAASKPLRLRKTAVSIVLQPRNISFAAVRAPAANIMQCAQDR